MLPLAINFHVLVKIARGGTVKTKPPKIVTERTCELKGRIKNEWAGLKHTV